MEKELTDLSNLLFENSNTQWQKQKEILKTCTDFMANAVLECIPAPWSWMIDPVKRTFIEDLKSPKDRSSYLLPDKDEDGYDVITGLR